MARILVLDDEKDACDLIERVLSPTYQVVTFTDEEAAIAYFKTNDVDLAILDIKLRKMSGVDVLSILREVRPDAKAVMLTGFPTVQTAQRAITLGAYDYLTKPIDIDRLEEKVRQVLEPSHRSGKGGEDSDLAEDLSPSE
ncbi:MAG: response regulator [Deltaproteobacteria bacterium]|nr:response regulator [Deltaproteobacteria bacterium]MBW2283261.1 response regulator [Deltaproteobacteria bacterium]